MSARNPLSRERSTDTGVRATLVDTIAEVMTGTTKQAIFSAIRSVLIALGAWGAGRGLISDKDVGDIVGSAMVIIPLVWGIIEKYHAEQMTKDRIADAVSTTAAAAPPDQQSGVKS